MNDKVFVCSICNATKPRSEFHETNAADRNRQVTSQCKTCRSEVYFKKRYPDTVCAQCLRHRQLDVNGVCAACNEESALRQCGKCLCILPSILSFYGGRRVCRNCSKARRATTKEAAAVVTEPGSSEDPQP